MATASRRTTTLGVERRSARAGDASVATSSRALASCGPRSTQTCAGVSDGGRPGTAVRAFGQLDRHVRGDALVPDAASVGVSHSTVPTRSAEPSDSSNSPRTVPVPYVVSPTIVARPASCSAPDTISALLAVLPSTRTTSGRSVATPSGETSWSVSPPCGVPFEVDDPAGQELAGDADRLVDVAAGIAAQVEDDPLGAGRRARP